MSHQPGEITAALKAGYRVAIHASFFPFEAVDHSKPGTTHTVHAVVDHGARAVFCSREWFEKSKVVA